MILSDISVKRPVAMSCLLIALALLGLNAYRKMGLELMPRIDLPYITVTTVYPGASPEQIETDVARRIEDQVVTIEGLKHVSSSCMENVCQTLLEFELGVDVDIAATDVREKIDLIKSEFPADVEDPKILKYDINAKPVLTLALVGELPLDELYDYADNDLRDKISVVSGVADIQLIGGAEREVQILLDREALGARGLTSMQVIEAVRNGVRTIPSGRVKAHGSEYSVKFDADFENIKDIGDLEIAGQNGQRCYVRDVAEVIMGTEEVRQMAEFNGEPCIAIKVIKKSDANAVKVVDQVESRLAQLNQQLPAGMQLKWVSDDGTFIRATNDSAWVNVGQGVLLTALILFIFLYNLRSLFVVAISMPLTIVIGLFFMQMLGYTLNTSTLLSIGMSVGILVTNSIVVLEAIVRRMDETGDPVTSSILGAKEAFVAVLASAVTNMVVLFPLARMQSMIGLFMEPFALTMLIMTIVSLFISFTFTPLLCSKVLKRKDPSSRGLLRCMENGWNRGFDVVLAKYRHLLQFFEKRRWAAALFVLAIVFLFFNALGLAGKLGGSMTPEVDRGELFAKLEFPSRYNLDETLEKVHEVQSRLTDLPELKVMLTTAGKVEGMVGQSSEGVQLVQILLKFSDRTERKIGVADLQEMARQRLSSVTDAIVTVSLPSIIGGQGSDVEMEIAGMDLEVLDALALKVQKQAKAIDGLKDVDTTVRFGKPELRVHPNRAVLADVNMPATGLGMIMRGNLEGIEAGTFKKDARNYDIVVKMKERKGTQQVENFLFPGAPGRPVNLMTLGEIEESQAPIQITRKDKQRVSKLYANLAPGFPLGLAVNAVNEIVNEPGFFPPLYEHRFVGDYERMSEGQSELGEAGLIALILVILSLAAILESFKQPWLILVTIPLALIGIIWALWLGGYSLSIFVIMGGVMLIGIVVNNAILIMDQFNIHIAEGVPRHRAMVEAATERFRPISMITLAAVLGMLPLAFGRGIGAEMRNDVGVASAGGILVSGLLTLFVMPILYDLVTRAQKKKNDN